MHASRSAIFKMTREKYYERQILSLPRPFLSDATPYKDINFSRITRECTKSYKFGMNISKVVILGDVAVGKTSLVNRFCHQVFETNYKATIGVDFEVERFDILDVPFNLQIWDTAGQERFKCIAQSYYRGANAIILVFSLNDSNSLKHTKSWLFEALGANKNSPLIFLVGTKRDKMSPSEYISFQAKAINMANDLHAEFWSVSSKTGDGVNNLFNRVAALTFNKTIQKEFEDCNPEIKFGNPLRLGEQDNRSNGIFSWISSIIILLIKPGKENLPEASKYRPIRLLPTEG